MKKILAALLLLSGINSFNQTDSAFYRAESVRFWEDQKAEYLDKEKSPLSKKARKIFVNHSVYKFDMNYVISAHMVKYSKEDTIIMQTSANTEKKYIKYGQLHLNIGRNHCHLTVYQSLTLRDIEQYKNDLFIPFKDLTNGVETYGGGRYLDIKIPETDQVILNFNLAYNPYCAVSDNYFCPIPPAENSLKVEVKAGAKMPVAN